MHTWKVQTKNNVTVELHGSEVVNLLMAELIKDEKEDHRVLSEISLTMFESNNVLSSMTLNALATMMFRLGYLYRIFCDKQKVEVSREENEDNSNENPS